MHKFKKKTLKSNLVISAMNTGYDLSNINKILLNVYNIKAMS